ncbi:MAG TPA: hypothetical protein EYG18_02355 [Micavibrio sp.]|nr:hypothetical protein [Micavibrio sp.]HIL28090.1 hypothetical protein [Micavibrio sp.]
MVANVGNILSGVQLRQLSALKATAREADGAQLRLATGLKVNNAIDDPDNFFAARTLNHRASDLQRLLDGIDNSLQKIKTAQHGVEAIIDVLNTSESFLNEYEQLLLAGEVDVEEVVDTSFFQIYDDPSAFTAYGGAGQDSGLPVQLQADNFGFTLDDNMWKRIAFGETITADTILEFDFRSTNIPEIAGIGFDNDTNFGNSNDQFFLYGTQLGGVPYSAPTPTYEYDGSGDWVHVTIPIGTFFTGNYSHMTFFADDDGGGDDGDASFRNVVVHTGEYVYGGTNLTVADTYEERYRALLSQIDQLALDTNYRGTNLLDGDDLTTFFNEFRSSSLETEGIYASSAGLGLEYEDFTTVEAVRAKIEQVKQAREDLRAYTSSLSQDFNILKSRNDFTQTMINVLLQGKDELTLTDQNEDGAELLALQTRQIIQTSVLALRTPSIADFLA